jgi:hypothetical protein
MKTRSGTIYSVPYSLEINDIVVHLVYMRPSDALLNRGMDQFDALYQECAGGARVMCVAVHPYVTGAPHRIRYFNELFEYMKAHEGVTFMTGAQILDWYLDVSGE